MAGGGVAFLVLANFNNHAAIFDLVGDEGKSAEWCLGSVGCRRLGLEHLVTSSLSAQHFFLIFALFFSSDPALPLYAQSVARSLTWPSFHTFVSPPALRGEKCALDRVQAANIGEPLIGQCTLLSHARMSSFTKLCPHALDVVIGCTELGDLCCVLLLLFLCLGTQMASAAAALAPSSPSAAVLSEAFFSFPLHEIIEVGAWGAVFLAKKTDSFKGPLLSLLGQNQTTDVVFLFV